MFWKENYTYIDIVNLVELHRTLIRGHCVTEACIPQLSSSVQVHTSFLIFVKYVRSNRVERDEESYNSHIVYKNTGKHFECNLAIHTSGTVFLLS
jgi:hypothetical protein